MVALEAERKTVQEAARKEAAEASKRVAALVPQGDAARQQVNVSSANQNLHKQGPASNGTRKSEPTEQTSELIKIFKNPSCPLSISIAAFAKKVASHCEIPDNAAFACGHVIVLVTSQFPHAMDLILAEFHSACIYTVPKHVVYLKSAFESKEAYYKTIGYQEQDGKVESTRDYLKRLESYMKLYGALVQTEIQGIQNTHGPKEGWAWLARFLNTLPANVYTAVALKAFLQEDAEHYLQGLSEGIERTGGSELKTIIIEIQSYIEDNRFLQEPEGWSMQSSLLSSVMVPDSEPSRGYYYY
ncbi:hypothetical protein GH714_028801 [Hevea brasiliensis]|uniref:mRNA export factor GLE1 n=1 Tax=Hevea brasiliensis TaxID=3981 RepID=A0A6A6LNS1_HEVBR|nr:hypothetical protein GH714_028801 [Hevea brasiliensis]